VHIIVRRPALFRMRIDMKNSMIDVSPLLARQRGFSMIELMVSLTLGLLLIGAASQLLSGGIVSWRLQQSSADLQDGGVFSFDYMAKDMRLLNYGYVNSLSLNPTTPWAGVVFSADTSATSTNTNLPLVRTSTSQTAYVPAGVLTLGNGDTVSTTANQWQGLTNVTGTGVTNSDQLTILYVAPNTMSNCAGAVVNQGDYVVERYFLRVDTTQPAPDPKIANLSLACDAGVITAASIAASSATVTGGVTTVVPAVLSGFGGAGQIIIPRVDHLHFLLGVYTAPTTASPSSAFSYYTINGDKAAVAAATAAGQTLPRVVSIQVAALVRAQVATSGKSGVDPTKSYQMFDQTVTPIVANTHSNNQFVRNVYTTTIAIRNGLGGGS